ncbi:MAG TPA: M43 family zinc metalloprotease [Saprospiraceae bacterium]|nr:M43 family zinc metalloprotease [Saprospiraceae bacterium]
MKTKLFIHFICLLFSCVSYNSIAQNCGTDALHELNMKTDPVYKAKYLAMKQELRKILDNNPDDKILKERGQLPVYTIPVVVHVIHKGEAFPNGTNISDLQVRGAINGLNEKYSKLIGAGLDVEIQFCLATRDPDGCPTNGINRVNGSVIPKYKNNGIAYSDTIGANDHVIKDLSRWPVDQYYNIWVVNKISGSVNGGGIAGYAYYPNGNDYDGTVLLSSEMTYTSKTLAHEVGHGLNLAHTFNGELDVSGCPINDDCNTQGDEICDTPPHGINDCGDFNPCTTEGDWDNSRYNYMSYCFPDITLSRFTQGQKDRMRATLLVNPRAALLNSQACTPGDFFTQSLKTNSSCYGDCDGTLTVIPTCASIYKYKWSNGDTSHIAKKLCPGTYTVTITNIIPVSEVLTLTVNENPLPQVDAGVDVNIPQGGSTKLGGFPTASGTPPFTFIWAPSSGLNQANIANPIASPDSTITYTVIVIDANGCNSLDNVKVHIGGVAVNPEPENTFGLKIYPNPFSSYLNISGTGITNGEYSFKITNLLGQRVYSSKEVIGNNTIDKQVEISNQYDGIYFLIIDNGTNRMVTKLEKIN